MTFENEDVIKMITAFKAEVESLRHENEDLRNALYRDFLEPASKEYKAWDRSNRLNDFREAHKDLLTDELCTRCKEIEGDDAFDLTEKVFSDYDESDKALDESEYVAQVVTSLNEQLNALKEKLNAEEVVVEANNEGDVEVKADGEVVAEAVSIDTNPSEASSEVSSDEVNSDNANSDEANSSAELDEFIKELEEEKANQKRIW